MSLHAIKDASFILEVSERKLRRMIKSGKIVGYKSKIVIARFLTAVDIDEVESLLIKERNDKSRHSRATGTDRPN